MNLSESNMFTLGMVSMVLGIVASFFMNSGLGFPVSAFLSGVFFGLSLVMNLGYLIRKRSVHTLKQSL